MASKARDIDEDEAMTTAEQTGTDPAVLAAAGSVMLSWYYFFGKKDAQKGLFIGLWPPTILAFASYFKQTQMSDHLQQSISSSKGFRESVQRVVGGQ